MHANSTLTVSDPVDSDCYSISLENSLSLADRCGDSNSVSDGSGSGFFFRIDSDIYRYAGNVQRKK
jgi:hypothetical protein